MEAFEITRYDASMKPEWNEFVRTARNATFLFHRDYMDYHSDRFEDCSWVVRKKGHIVALLPANISSDGTLHSHEGLSYGGWVLPSKHLDGADLLSIFMNALKVWKREGISALDYKPLPWIYAAQPSEEDIYALFRLGASLSECNLSSTISRSTGWQPNKLQKRHLASASRMEASISEPSDILPFMEMLAACLKERHDTVPVHTPEELGLLMSRFPENIRVFTIGDEAAPQAGICIYDTGRVAHAQYIATTAEGRKNNMLTPLVHYLVAEKFADREFFDFGISNENHGLWLNEGLLRQKSSFGATGTVYTRYRLNF